MAVARQRKSVMWPLQLLLLLLTTAVIVFRVHAIHANVDVNGDEVEAASTATATAATRTRTITAHGDRDGGDEGNDKTIAAAQNGQIHKYGTDQQEAQRSFFQAHDTNSDGTLEQSEMREHLASLGGERLDQDTELSAAAARAVSAIDRNKMQGIQASELLRHWNRVALRLSSVADVEDWVVNAVQLPRYAKAFKENAITGHDFPFLLEDSGAALREIGVASSVHRRVMMRAITMVLLGVSPVPVAPQLSCSVDVQSCIASVLISKNDEIHVAPLEENMLPVHKWRAHVQENGGPSTQSWVLILDEPAFTESAAHTEMQLCADYDDQCSCDLDAVVLRAEAWNAIGRSAYTRVRVSECRREERREAAVIQSDSASWALSREQMPAVVELGAVVDPVDPAQCAGPDCRPNELTCRCNNGDYNIHAPPVQSTQSTRSMQPGLLNTLNTNIDGHEQHLSHQHSQQVKMLGGLDVSSGARELFLEADRDGDGDVDPAEMASFIHSQASRLASDVHRERARGTKSGATTGQSNDVNDSKGDDNSSIHGGRAGVDV